MTYDGDCDLGEHGDFYNRDSGSQDWVLFEAFFMHETAKAYGLATEAGGVITIWVPKSQVNEKLSSLKFDGMTLSAVAIPRWLAETKDLEYEEANESSSGGL